MAAADRGAGGRLPRNRRAWRRRRSEPRGYRAGALPQRPRRRSGNGCQENGKLCVICPERCPLASSCYDGLACRATRWISVRVDYFDPLVYCDGGSDFACPDGGTCDRRCLGVVCP